MKCTSSQIFWLVLDFIHIRTKQVVEKWKVQMVWSCFHITDKLLDTVMIWEVRTMRTDKGHRNSSTKQYTAPWSALNWATCNPGHTEKQIHLATMNSSKQSVTFQKAEVREMIHQLVLLIIHTHTHKNLLT